LLSGSGSVVLDPAAGFPVDLAFDLSAFTAVRREEGEVPFDGRLTVTGTADALLLAGQLVVPAAELRIPESLPPEIVTLEVIEVGAGAPPAEPAESGKVAPGEARASLAVDVEVTMPGRVFLRGRGLTSEVLGELTLVRGTFDLVGKTLKLEQGSVRFDKDRRNDPLIHLLATIAVEDATARVEVSGRSSNPEVVLSAEPPLPAEEIMARILFGTRAEELTPVQALQLANGLATLSGAGGGASVLDTLRRGLGADVLEVRAGEDGPAGTTVRAGRYIADDVMLYLEQGAAAGSTRATLEAEVTDHISVETDIGADARSSIGINVKTDY
jgi:translocation and assembly module TamB